jgi:hypothetical protein
MRIKLDAKRLLGFRELQASNPGAKIGSQKTPAAKLGITKTPAAKVGPLKSPGLSA